MIFWVPILSYVAVLLLTALSYSRAAPPRGPGLLAKLLLRYICLFPVGLMGLWAALGHIMFPARSAAGIGWATSPFQIEVGAANLGIGLAGLIGAFYPNWGFRLAVAVMTAGFLGGAAVNHLIEIAEAGNYAAGNAGPILYTDVLTPLLLLILLALTYRSGRAASA
ncbi:UNVERIFIED_ORG: hypothetical protein ABID33_000832 [Xanthobacter viscosus]|jgi:hypothetical protein|uniref:Uncharacterized protein n=1 Tax=Xanthobacter autotrophicus TaxID=280 RepID=A0A6C1KG75_XANAU|nr:DUF6790 family protein [Xanthobacter autotrophicus]TLX43205.1 hypothetical protein FBQ73_11265 [Xanthobacter autotrophicus]